MDLGPSDRGRRAQVALIAVEVTGGDAETLAAQWAQDVRHRLIAHGVTTGAAVGMVFDGTIHDLADAVRAAHDGLTK